MAPTVPPTAVGYHYSRVKSDECTIVPSSEVFLPSGPGFEPGPLGHEVILCAFLL